MEGWIKLYRKILDNPINCKDSEYFSVWIYLLLNATHTEYDTVFKGERITLKSGQLITGRKAIAEKFKIDENKVQRILKTLEKQHQIEQQTSNKNRLISIINWNEYQEERHQVEQQVNNKRTTSEQQVNTNKNDKNVKNEKEEKNNIVEIYNETCTNLPKVSKITDKRKNNIRKFLKEFTIDDFSRICNIANTVPFLIGKNERGWKADFDFLVKPDKATAILEGKYGNSIKTQDKTIVYEQGAVQL